MVVLAEGGEDAQDSDGSFSRGIEDIQVVVLAGGGEDIQGW